MTAEDRARRAWERENSATSPAAKPHRHVTGSEASTLPREQSCVSDAISIARLAAAQPGVLAALGGVEPGGSGTAGCGAADGTAVVGSSIPPQVADALSMYALTASLPSPSHVYDAEAAAASATSAASAAGAGSLEARIQRGRESPHRLASNTLSSDTLTAPQSRSTSNAWSPTPAHSPPSQRRRYLQPTSLERIRLEAEDTLRGDASSVGVVGRPLSPEGGGGGAGERPASPPSPLGPPQLMVRAATPTPLPPRKATLTITVPRADSPTSIAIEVKRRVAPDAAAAALAERELLRELHKRPPWLDGMLRVPTPQTPERDVSPPRPACGGGSRPATRDDAWPRRAAEPLPPPDAASARRAASDDDLVDDDNDGDGGVVWELSCGGWQQAAWQSNGSCGVPQVPLGLAGGGRPATSSSSSRPTSQQQQHRLPQRAATPGAAVKRTPPPPLLEGLPPVDATGRPRSNPVGKRRPRPKGAGATLTTEPARPLTGAMAPARVLSASPSTSMSALRGRHPASAPCISVRDTRPASPPSPPLPPPPSAKLSAFEEWLQQMAGSGERVAGTAHPSFSPSSQVALQAARQRQRERAKPGSSPGSASKLHVGRASMSRPAAAVAPSPAPLFDVRPPSWGELAAPHAAVLAGSKKPGKKPPRARGPQEQSAETPPPDDVEEPRPHQPLPQLEKSPIVVAAMA